MALHRVLLLSAVVAIVSGSRAAPGEVIGQLRKLQDVLPNKDNATAKAPEPPAQAPPAPEAGIGDRLKALRDHLRGSKTDEPAAPAKPAAAVPEQKAAGGVVEVPSSQQVAAPEVKATPAAAAPAVSSSQPAAVNKTEPKAAVPEVKAAPPAAPVHQEKSVTTVACECAPGAECPAVCTQGIKKPGAESAAVPPAPTAVTTPTVAAVAGKGARAVPKVSDRTKPAPDTKMPTPASNWTDFAAEVSGANVVQPASFLHGLSKVRGLAATKDVAKDAQVLEVPENLVLSPEHPVLKQFYGNTRLKDPDTTWRLIGFLAAEKTLGNASPWAQYFQHLPSKDDYEANHPLWAKPALLERFVPVPVVRQVHQYQRMFKEDLRVWKLFVKAANQQPEQFAKAQGLTEHVRSLRQAVTSVSKDDLMWAFTVVLTRGFGTAHGTALAPVADDFNTDLAQKQNARWHAKPGGAIEVVATEPVQHGQELLINYASKPEDNEKYASVWGFALANNTANVARLSFEDCRSLAERIVRKGKFNSHGDSRPGGPKAASSTPTCTVPASETQPGIYCTLLELAREHCPYVKELQQ